MTLEDKQALSSVYKAQIARLGTPISIERYKELRNYASEYGVKLSGFRNYVGDTETIETVINDIYEIAKDFPKILDERRGVILELDFGMSDEDFATTDSGHVIKLNAVYFSDLERLNMEYKQLSQKGYFVLNSDWRAICRHEVGHVVANLYDIDPLKIALEIKHTTNKIELFEDLSKDLSLYSTSYEDGREIVSECFSAYYGKNDNSFVSAFIKRCMDICEG